jgi:pimeloyl-ACP methyl ester carboxylesterase
MSSHTATVIRRQWFCSRRIPILESAQQPRACRTSAIAIIAPMERDLHHEVRGTGEPLLLVHGTGSSLHVWDPVVERLAARRTVIAVDLPGFGASPPLTSAGPPPAPAGFAGVLTDFLG